MAGSALTPKVGGALAPDNIGKGTMLAIGVLLLWFSGLLFFVAFMSGKAASLISGKDSSTGAPSGPRNMSELVQRASANIQALEGGGSGVSGASTSTGSSGAESV